MDETPSTSRPSAAAAVFLVVMVSMCFGCTPASQRHTFERPLMGTTFRIVVYAEHEGIAKDAAEAAYARLTHLNSVMSDYDPRSELSKLSGTSGSGAAVRVSDELWHVLLRATEMSAASDGAFDVTVGPIVHLWRRARRQTRMPAQRRMDDALKATGYQHMKLDASKRTVELTQPNMKLDLGGIAKGYAADEALRVLRAHGLTRALIDAGGDIVLGDAPPHKNGWRIGIAPLGPKDGPSRYLLLSNVSVATSGDAWQHVVIDGKRYSHIVNPKTGIGLTDQSGVTVIAPNGTTADALASAVSVLGPTKGIALIEATPGASAMVVRNKAGAKSGIETHESSRMKDHRVAPEKVAADPFFRRHMRPSGLRFRMGRMMCW